jgi:hypothetical protein
LLFAVDGRKHVVKGLLIEQAIHIVFTGETGRHVFFVLEQAILWGAGNADVRKLDVGICAIKVVGDHGGQPGAPTFEDLM